MTKKRLAGCSAHHRIVILRSESDEGSRRKIMACPAPDGVRINIGAKNKFSIKEQNKQSLNHEKTSANITKQKKINEF